jgi:MFS family permease
LDELQGDSVVAAISIVVGLILIALGVGGYLATMTSLTALIPAVLGLLLVAFGLLARKEKMRMHAMHGAVLVGLIGLIGGLARIVPALLNDSWQRLAFAINVAMAVTCLVFVALCVKSFIDARRRRRQTNP